jgi:carboxypeptidase Taq
VSSGANERNYSTLEQRLRELGSLAHAQRMLGWDEAVMMPVGGGERRGEVLATIAGLVHRQMTSNETGDLIAAAEQEAGLDPWQRANVREIARSRLHATALPSALVVEHSLQSTRCEQAWRIARGAND